MRYRFLVIGASAALCLSAHAVLGQPDPSTSSCEVVITQGACPLPECIASSPPVVRLCPAGGFDQVDFRVVVRDSLGTPLAGIPLKPVERTGSVNLRNGGYTTPSTNANGEATVSITAGSGFGRVGVCAGGVLLICEIAARSPDVATNHIPANCPLTTSGTSFVNGTDYTNWNCGFGRRFGAVTIGVNSDWDLDCSEVVNSADIFGNVCPPFGRAGGLIQHFNHGGQLGPKNVCP